MDAPFQIRPANSADRPALADLERRCFSDPWSEESLAEAVASPLGVNLVVEVDGVVVAYLMARVLAPTAEIMNLAVAPGRRRQGLAAALLAAGLVELTARGAGEVFLEVRASNHPAQALYREAGFRPIGVRAGYYEAPREDALVLRRMLDTGA